MLGAEAIARKVYTLRSGERPLTSVCVRALSSDGLRPCRDGLALEGGARLPRHDRVPSDHGVGGASGLLVAFSVLVRSEPRYGASDRDPSPEECRAETDMDAWYRSDLHANQAFDISQIGTLFLLAERHRAAGGAGATRAPDTVDVSFWNVGKIEVDHEAELVDVDAAGRDVGGDERPQSRLA